MRPTLFLRALAGIVLVLVVAVGLFAWYSFRQARLESRERVAAELTGVCRAARPALAGVAARGDRGTLEQAAREVAAATGARITVIAADGTVLADSEADPASMEGHAQRPEVVAALEGRVGVSSRVSTTTGRASLYVAMPLDPSSPAAAALRASAPLGDVEALLVSARRSASFVAAAALLLGLFVAVLATRRITTPIRLLTSVVRSVSGGDFTARLHLRRRDEVRELADSVNAMAERLQGLFDRLDRSRSELDGLFASVREGIAVLDAEGRILRCNPGFERLAGAGEAAGRLLWELIWDPALADAVRSTAGAEGEAPELAHLGRTLRAEVTTMGGSGDRVLVLHDVSEARMLEEAKRELVANVSHELRTPLTAIRGYLEMLEEEVRGEGVRMLGAARRNVDRMSAIVNDLLVLARLEAPGVAVEEATADLAAAAEDVVRLFGPRAAARGIALEVSFPPGLPAVRADPHLVEELLVNLVDNAVRYTERGAIRLTAAAEGDLVRIAVEDTGIGIAAEHLPRLFERFYVVDKARSRETGGTGLGLAIVKHIAERHGGTVEVESALGRGTRFTVRLPAGGRTNQHERNTPLTAS